MDGTFMMNNLEKLLGGTQKMQSRIERMKRDLGELRVTGDAGGGAVRVTVDGNRRVLEVKISEDSMGDRALLQDLIAAAVAAAMQKAEEAANEKMQVSMTNMLSGIF